MKRFWLLSLLLLGGCMSATLDQFKLVTPDDITAKIKANNDNENDKYDLWRYAGSDDQYDYFYEYEPGIFLTQPHNFKYYKLPRGDLKLDGRYPFAPDVKKNTQIFEW